MTAENESLTRSLAEFTATTDYGQIPDRVVHEAKRLLLDTIGCAVGALPTPSGAVALDYARLQGAGTQSTVLGLDARATAGVAAWANTRLANILDADDTFPTSSHFGNSTVFTALALAEQFGCSGQELLAAIAVGFDVGARIGNWLGWPVIVHEGEIDGWNPLAGPAATVTWAALGASASIIGLTTDQTIEAFGIGGANTPMPAMNKFGAMSTVPMHKYTDAGWCAAVGVNSALLASLGSTGLEAILDGDYGFWRFYGSLGHDDARLLQGLRRDWELLNTSYKPWPSCRFIHQSLTAFDRLRTDERLSPHEIDRIVVRTMPFAYQAKFLNAHPDDELSAEFSYAHSFAAVAHDIPVGAGWFSADAMGSEAMRAFRDRVHVEVDPDATRAIVAAMDGPQFRDLPASVQVHARGRVFEAASARAKGDPWWPDTAMSDDELRAKFTSMVRGADERTHAESDALSREVFDAIDGLETLGVAPLTALLRRLARVLTTVPA
jgi:2-methylcitrate dehydratase PrpD